MGTEQSGFISAVETAAKEYSKFAPKALVEPKHNNESSAVQAIVQNCVRIELLHKENSLRAQEVLNWGPEEYGSIMEEAQKAIHLHMQDLKVAANLSAAAARLELV